jgi:glutamate--cysteine ligase catalytic subunit
VSIAINAFVICSQYNLTFTTFIGLLQLGVPKTWEQSKKDLRYIRRAGVRQFISTYYRVKDLKGDELLWGDEIEYGIFHLDSGEKKVRISLRGKEVRDPFTAPLFF